MIRFLRLINFRLFEYLELPLNQVTILVGRNNTGKSTVVEALAIVLSLPRRFHDVLGLDIVEVMERYRGGCKYLVRTGAPYSEVELRLDDETIRATVLTGPLQDKEGLLREAGHLWEGILRLLMERARTKFREKLRDLEAEIRALEHRYRILESRALEKKLEALRMQMEDLVRRESEFVAQYLREDLKREDLLAAVLQRGDSLLCAGYVTLRDKEVAVEIFDSECIVKLPQVLVRVPWLRRDLKGLLTRLEQEVEPLLRVVEFLRKEVPYFWDLRGEKIVFRFGERTEIVPLDATGDGLRSLIELLVPISLGAELVLLEEPERHMHPGYLDIYCRELVKQLRKENAKTQYVITTHSLEFLRDILDHAREEEVLDKVTVVRLHRLPDGTVDAEVIPGKEAYNELEELGSDLRGI